MTDLSPRELEVLYDSEFLRTKAQVTIKVQDLLGQVERELQALIRASSFPFPPGALDQSGKISRGEKYRGLPYLVLDYPRRFQPHSKFAYRTIFLWGDSFSNTLHLAGEDLNSYRGSLKTGIGNLRGKDFFICNNASQWEHHFGPDNYVPLDDIQRKDCERLIDQPFLKLARKLEISSWKELCSYSTTTLDLVLECLVQ